MAYKQTKNNYIIDNDVEEIDNPEFQKEMKMAADLNDKLPEGFEIEENTKVDPALELQREIQEEAAKEGLVSDDEFLGGKGASPEEVIEAMKKEGLSEGAKERKKNIRRKNLRNLKQLQQHVIYYLIERKKLFPSLYQWLLI